MFLVFNFRFSITQLESLLFHQLSTGLYCKDNQKIVVENFNVPRMRNTTLKVTERT